MKPFSVKNILYDQYGTASIEAAIMLPIMAICWAGIFFYLNGYGHKMEAAVEARYRAWSLSNDGCRSSSRIYDCSHINSDEGAADSLSWLDVLTEIPIVGYLFGSIFGYATTVHTYREWETPGLFGGATRRSEYSYYIMCNEESMTITSLLKSVICQELENFPFDLGCPPARHRDVGAQCFQR